MPIRDYDPMYAIDVNLTATHLDHMMKQQMNQINHMHSQVSTSASAHRQETLEWAKFAMWLRGFLGALEGKELSAEDVNKIMDKLAIVDPESQNWRFGDTNPYIPQPPPYNPVPPGSWPSPNTGVPHWTYRDSTTITNEQIGGPTVTITDGTAPPTNKVKWK